MPNFSAIRPSFSETRKKGAHLQVRKNPGHSGPGGRRPPDMWWTPSRPPEIGGRRGMEGCAPLALCPHTLLPESGRFTRVTPGLLFVSININIDIEIDNDNHYDDGNNDNDHDLYFSACKFNVFLL